MFAMLTDVEMGDIPAPLLDDRFSDDEVLPPEDDFISLEEQLEAIMTEDSSDMPAVYVAPIAQVVAAPMVDAPIAQVVAAEVGNKRKEKQKQNKNK
jgi:hypothetical protein